MKTKTVLRLITGLVLSGIIGFFLFQSCEKDEDIISKKTEEVTTKSLMTTQQIVYCGTTTTVDFLAGQTIKAGTVLVGNDATNLYVTYTTIDGWKLNQTHLYVGACELIPLNKSNNPIIGQFPYSTAHSPQVTTFTYTIPLSQLPDCMCVAAHAEVVKVDGSNNVIQTETAWGQGTDMGGKSWAMKFNYCKQTCVSNPKDVCYQTETAWVSGTRYTSQGNWATYVTYNSTAVTLPIYAGQTINAGTASLSNVVSGNVTITITLSNGWELQNVAESVKIQGYTAAPSGNPSPGLFTTYKGNSLTVTVPYYKYYGIHLDVQKVIPCNQ